MRGILHSYSDCHLCSVDKHQMKVRNEGHQSDIFQQSLFPRKMPILLPWWIVQCVIFHKTFIISNLRNLPLAQSLTREIEFLRIFFKSSATAASCFALKHNYTLSQAICRSLGLICTAQVLATGQVSSRLRALRYQISREEFGWALSSRIDTISQKQ